MIAPFARNSRGSFLVGRVFLCCACLSTGPPASAAAASYGAGLAFVRRVPSGQPSLPQQVSLLRQGRRRRQERTLSERRVPVGTMGVQNQIDRDHFERRSSSARPACNRAPSAMEALECRDSGSLADEKEVLGHRWLLLRHGQTNYNADGRVQGSSDTSRLSEEGRRQARAVGAFLQTLEIEKVYISPLARAQETLQHAEEVAGKQFADRKIVMNELREVDLHEWEGMYKQKIKEKWPEIYRQWRGDSPSEFRLESGAFPIRDLWSRAGDVWQQVLSDVEAEEGQGDRALLTSRRHLITGHNGINQALLATALGMGSEAFRKLEFQNCAVAEVAWNPGEEKARVWRWIYPERTPWKTAAETVAVLETSNASEEANDSTSSSPCND